MSECRDETHVATYTKSSTLTTDAIWMAPRWRCSESKTPDERAALRDRIYRDVTDMQQSIRDREIIAQRDRRRSARRGTTTPQDIADELWTEHESSLNLLQFPEDFLTRSNEGALFDLPSGEVEVGEAMMDTGDLLKVGTIRVGGRYGEVH